MASAVGLSTRMRMLAADEGRLMGSLVEARRKSDRAVTAAVSWLTRLPSMRSPSLRGDFELETAPPLLPEAVDEDEASAREERWYEELDMLNNWIGCRVFPSKLQTGGARWGRRSKKAIADE